MRQLGVCTGNRNGPKLTLGAPPCFAVRMRTNYSSGLDIEIAPIGVSEIV